MGDLAVTFACVDVVVDMRDTHARWTGCRHARPRENSSSPEECGRKAFVSGSFDAVHLPSDDRDRLGQVMPTIDAVQVLERVSPASTSVDASPPRVASSRRVYIHALSAMKWHTRWPLSAWATSAPGLTSGGSACAGIDGITPAATSSRKSWMGRRRRSRVVRGPHVLDVRSRLSAPRAWRAGRGL